MAVKPFDRYLKDKQEGEAIGEPGGVNTIEEMKESFQRALENLSEPTKPTKFLDRLYLEKQTKEK